MITVEALRRMEEAFFDDSHFRSMLDCWESRDFDVDKDGNVAKAEESDEALRKRISARLREKLWPKYRESLGDTRRLRAIDVGLPDYGLDTSFLYRAHIAAAAQAFTRMMLGQSQLSPDTAKIGATMAMQCVEWTEPTQERELPEGTKVWDGETEWSLLESASLTRLRELPVWFASKCEFSGLRVTSDGGLTIQRPFRLTVLGFTLPESESDAELRERVRRTADMIAAAKARTAYLVERPLGPTPEQNPVVGRIGTVNPVTTLNDTKEAIERFEIKLDFQGRSDHAREAERARAAKVQLLGELLSGPAVAFGVENGREWNGRRW